MTSDEMVPLPPQAVPASQLGESADQPKLDVLVGETICVKALEWIGEGPDYMGVRLYLHVVQGQTMTKRATPYRAYTEAVKRVARQLVNGATDRQVRLETWPIYKVVKSGNSYSLADV